MGDILFTAYENIPHFLYFITSTTTATAET